MPVGQAVEVRGSGMGGSSPHDGLTELVREDAVLPYIVSFRECDAGPANERRDQGRVEPGERKP